MLENPDGHGHLELVKFHSPPVRGGDRDAPANTLGIRHVACRVDGLEAVVASLRGDGAELVGEVEQYETSIGSATSAAREGIIVELAERIG